MNITEERLIKIESAYERVDARVSDAIAPAGRGHRSLESLRAEMEARYNVLRTDMYARFASLRAEIDAQFADLPPGIDPRIDEMREEIETNFEEMKTELEANLAELRAEMDSTFNSLQARVAMRFRIGRMSMEHSFIVMWAMAMLNGVLYFSALL